MSSKNKTKIPLDLKDKEKIKHVIAHLADGKLEKEAALERIIKIMDDYADKAVISFLQVEGRGLNE